MTLQGIRDLLLNIGPPVFHYFASGQTGNYIVWAEDSEGDSLHADGRKTEQVTQGTIDYFTKTEYDPVVKQIEDKLDSQDELAWKLNSIQREQDTGYIHYEWVWEMVCSGEDDDSGS